MNYDSRFHGPVRVRDALANSYNIPAVLTLQSIGVPKLLEIAQRFGMTSLGTDASQYGLSLTLGGGEVTALDMATAYSVFANGGHRIETHLIAKVTDHAGNVLYQAPDTPGDEVLDPRIAFMISDILSDNAARTPAMGPNSPLVLDFPAAAKTGTTNDFHDNWTIGYTPHLVVAVWAGNTDNSPMNEGASGLTGAAPIWHDYMEAIYQDPKLSALLEGPDLPPLRSGFPTPPGLEPRQVCVLSSLSDPAPASDGCPRTRAEWFRVGGATGAEPTATPTEPPTPTPAPTLAEGETPQPPLPPVNTDMGDGLFAIGVLPLDETQQASVVEALKPLWDALPDSVPTPSAPLYCEVPQANADNPLVSFQVFIAAPQDPADAVRARNWAYAHHVPIVPGVACPQEIVDQLSSPAALIDPLTGATYSISSPRPQQDVWGVLPIIGTAAFDQRVVYYKLEIGPGDIPTEWLTLGDTHDQNVVDGQLETLHADALPPGPYVLRLVLVRNDGNFLPPYQVPITIVPEPTPTPSP